jgi:hypothetical protein
MTELKGLIQERVDSGSASSISDVKRAVAADHQDGNRGTPMDAAPDALNELHAVDAGQIEIGDDHIERRVGGEHVECGFCIVHRRNVTERREDEFEERANVHIVIGHENALSAIDASVRGKILHIT